jgi:tetratricopeptide (TPR) repeat protein
MARASETLAHAIRIGLGTAAFVWGATTVASSRGLGALVTVPVATVAGLVAAICFLPYIAAPAMRWAESLFVPSGKRIRLRRDFCQARSLAKKGDPEGAVAQLRQAIADDSEHALEAQAVLAELLYDDLNRPDEALATVRDALARPEWREEMEALTRLGADILLERERVDQAKELLAQSAQRAKPHSQAERLRAKLRNL